MRPLNPWLYWLMAAVFVLSPCVSAADLAVEVLGVRSNEGFVHIGLYDNAEAFPTMDGRLSGGREAISANRAVFVFKGLEPGRYALAVYHDENANGEFDQILFGLPVEDFGFSNGARAFFGPPGYADAAVLVPPEGAKIIIRID